MNTTRTSSQIAPRHAVFLNTLCGAVLCAFAAAQLRAAPQSAEIVADLSPQSSDPAEITRVGTKLFYVADDGTHGREVFVHDLSRGTTRLLADIAPGSATSSPAWLRNLGGRLVFVATTKQAGRELWSSDGTTAGTQILTELAPGVQSLDPRELSVVGNRIYFTALLGLQARRIWETDGSAQGTRMHSVRDWFPAPRNFCHLGPDGRFVFEASNGVWMSEDKGLVSQLSGHLVGRQLKVADGITNVGDRVIFRTETNPQRRDTPGVATCIGNVWDTRHISNAEDSRSFTQHEDGALFLARGDQLWRSSGTSSSTRALDLGISTRLSSLAALTSLGARGFAFRATDAAHGSELWISDGTAQGTRLLADVEPGTGSSNPSNPGVRRPRPLVTAAGYVYFAADSSRYGRELFRVKVGAISKPFGSSCNAQRSPRARYLHLLASPARTGQSLRLRVRTLRGGALLLAFGAPAERAIALPGSCRSVVDLAKPFFYLAGAVSSGEWSTSLAVPSDSTLHGAELTAQGFALQGWDVDTTTGLRITIDRD